MCKDYKRVELKENAQDGLFLLIGERQDGVWSFVGRSTWESVLYPVNATEERITHAEVYEN